MVSKLLQILGYAKCYSDATWIFTKILKPVFGHLGNQGHISVIFVNDSYLQGDTKHECMNSINATIDLLSSLGFSIHKGKSVLIPTQKIEFLGFLIDSKNMKISLTNKKAEHLTLKIKKFLVNKSPNIRKLASIMGSVISIFHAVPLGTMHYRDLEREKVPFLKKESGNFEAKIALNQHIVTELQWWLDAIPNAVSDIHILEVDFIINVDASESDWGATDGVNPTG